MHTNGAVLGILAFVRAVLSMTKTTGLSGISKNIQKQLRLNIFNPYGFPMHKLFLKQLITMFQKLPKFLDTMILFTLVGFSRSKADCRLQNFANNFSRILKIRLLRPDLKLSALCLTFEIFMCNIFFSKIISVFSRTHFIHFLEHPIKRPLTLESCIQANIGNGFV